MFKFVSRKALYGEMDAARNSAQQAWDLNEQLKRENVTLALEKEKLERTIRLMQDGEVAHRAKIDELKCEVNVLRTAAVEREASVWVATNNVEIQALKEENGILRQILEDITTRDPDELIAIFKKIVREEAYGTIQKRDRKDDYHEDGV